MLFLSPAQEDTMTKLFHFSLVGLAAVALPMLTATEARAGLASCGNIDVEANAQCKVQGPEISCQAACEPLEFRAACSARLEASCSGTCEPPRVTAECTASCEAECAGSCEADPGSFDCDASCEGSCDANCSADCSAHCEAQAEAGSASGECEAECEASCQANCDAKCEASCEGDAPELECDGRCEASCEGQCKAEVDFDCQVECQSEGYAQCEAELRGGCEAECETSGGVASCDGEYIDHGGRLEDCLESIEATITAHIDGYAEFQSSSSCEGGSCEASASGEAGVSCSVAPGFGGNAMTGAWVGLGLLGLGLRRRRARR